LTAKASKFNLEEIENKLQGYYDGLEIVKEDFESMLDEKIEQLKSDEISNVLDKVNSIRNELVKEVNLVTKAQFSKIKKQIYESLGGHPISRAEFENRIKLKVDKEYLDKYEKLIEQNKVDK
jgi:hypothetical protein